MCLDGSGLTFLVMPRLPVLVAIALGGACGALLRFAIHRWVHLRVPHELPAGTFVVNVVGCLALGFCMVWMKERASEAWRMGVMVGLIGALTTFSTFAMESMDLLSRRERLIAGLYLSGSVVAGLVAVWAGMMIARSLR